MTSVSGRPEPTEYAEYYGRYIGKIDGTDVVGVLEHQLHDVLLLLSGIDERMADFRYEPGKWSVKELLGHVIDAERVFAYRALVFARNDTTAQAGFDQDEWAAGANYSSRSLADISAELEAVRRATTALFRNLDASAWTRVGTANGKNMSARAAAFAIAGHLEHHLEILKSRYLGQ